MLASSRPLKAGDTSVLTEKLILTHEGCEADEA